MLGVPPRAVEVCEIKVERAADAAPILATLPEGVTAYFELPIDEDPAPLAGGRGRAKVRTGGLTPEAFPVPADLARFLHRCAAARVPFKATAGLHHPIRSVQRCTYRADSPTALMHGFVNVFLAAALLWHGGSAGDAIATLEEESPGEFHFDDQRRGVARASTHAWRNSARRASSSPSASAPAPSKSRCAICSELGWL